ncbi:hypothetical protein QFC19_009265 [Naganishia cerealis]|uniref:Uncharacterized protein n=1 Tax=Naganishia cerealis TaxID=610337 RepID=A0ACC2UX75_9TREE|nr:hypothetical protein QFC19_009265 [Naganishia cerealis]
MAYPTSPDQDMNVTGDDPIRPASPDQTMVNKQAASSSDGYHAPAPGKPGSVPLITVQPLKKQEMQPSYAQDLGVNSIEHGVYGSFINTLGGCLGFLGAIPCCPFPNPYKRVEQGSVGLVSRFGQFYKTMVSSSDLPYASRREETKDWADQWHGHPVGNWWCSFWYVGHPQDWRRSEKQRILNPSPPLIPIAPAPTRINTTKRTVDIDSVICWHVVSPYRAAYGISNVSNALIERAQTTLRQVVGSRLLQTIVVDREGLAAEIQDILQNLLSSAATQKRIGESKVISARAEVDAAKLMRQAADIRQLDALQNMAKNAGSKVVFVPMNLSSMGSAGMSDAGRQEVQNQITASVHPDAEQARAFAQANQGQVGYLASEHAGPSGTSSAGPTMDLSRQVHNAGTYNSIERV